MGESPMFSEFFCIVHWAHFIWQTWKINSDIHAQISRKHASRFATNISMASQALHPPTISLRASKDDNKLEGILDRQKKTHYDSKTATNPATHELAISPARELGNSLNLAGIQFAMLKMTSPFTGFTSLASLLS